jgi:hypothetical protein
MQPAMGPCCIYPRRESIMPAANTGATEAQAAADAQPQEGASQAQAADAQSPQEGGADHESGTADVALLRRERAAADREAQRLRAELKGFQDAQRKADEAKLSDAERSTKRMAELERQNEDLTRSLLEERLMSRVMAAAQRLGFADPGDAFSLIDQGDLVIEDGYPKNVDKVLKDLLTRKPYLASTTARASGSAEGGVRGTSRPGNDMNALIRQAAGRS